MGSEQFTVAEFLEWARTKPADEAYCYEDNGRCAIGQFLKQTGRAIDPNVGDRVWDDLERLDEGLEDVPFEPALNIAAEASPRTFGALVTRLEALVQEAPSPWLNPQTYIDCDCGEQVK